jgi:hypothetical protein
MTGARARRRESRLKGRGPRPAGRRRMGRGSEVRRGGEEGGEGGGESGGGEEGEGRRRERRKEPKAWRAAGREGKGREVEEE